MGAGEKAVNLCISLISIYAIWLGILELVEKSGLNKVIAKLLSPLIKFLFGNQPEEVKNELAVNLSANMLGMGNASTPSGIKAMQMLDDKSGKATKPMIMLMLINSMSLQIIPTTLIGMRIASGSTDPTNIIFPILITSFVSTFIGVFMVKLFYKEKKSNIKPIKERPKASSTITNNLDKKK
ncbi:MAG: hypothetical protein KBT30_00265 [Clostridiales bacterium]|nr:hypothetical protein [Candidatus Apopatousia equi]